MDITGKVVLVVGGGGCIGLGIAKALAGKGCKVALADCDISTLGPTVIPRGSSRPPAQ